MRDPRIPVDLRRSGWRAAMAASLRLLRRLEVEARDCERNRPTEVSEGSPGRDASRALRGASRRLRETWRPSPVDGALALGHTKSSTQWLYPHRRFAVTCSCGWACVSSFSQKHTDRLFWEHAREIVGISILAPEARP